MKTKNYLDLTYQIEHDMPCLPTENVVIKQTANIENDGFNAKEILLYSHTGTHIDAPYHMLQNGLSLDNIPLNYFINSCKVVDLDSANVLNELNNLQDVTAIIIKTNQEQKYNSKKYYEDIPLLTTDMITLIKKSNIRLIGIDAVSFDHLDSSDYPIHLAFLKQNILLVENLCNLEQLPKEIFTLVTLPLKILASDGAPCRAIAIY